MLKHLNAFSFFGSITAFFGYIGWVQTLSVLALVVSIAAGVVTFSYTIYKWKKEIRRDAKKDIEANN